MGNKIRDNIDLLETAKRRKRVLEKRREGKTYREIASEVEEEVGTDRLPSGWGPRYAHSDVDRELEKYRDDLRESAEKIVELEIQRIDEMLVAHYPAAKMGDTEAGEFVVQLMERRADLLGLDEAEEYLLTGPGEDEGFTFGWADPAEAPSVEDFLQSLREQLNRAREQFQEASNQEETPRAAQEEYGFLHGVERALDIAEQHLQTNQDQTDE